MSISLLDVDEILLENDQWAKLEEKWGEPIDLETEEDLSSTIASSISTFDLKMSTFDSTSLLKKVRRKLGRKLSKKSTLSASEYADFLRDLQKDDTRESSKQFYYINGEIVSAVSVEEICYEIDDIFKSIEKLASESGTVRKKVEVIPETVNCSISVDGLSFDDTVTFSNEKNIDDIDKCIEEALDRFSTTLASLDGVDESTIESVATLVRKFSTILNTPIIKSSTRQKPSCLKFKDLADFWTNRAFNESFNGKL